MILLDTHALIWWVEGRGRLSRAGVEAIREHAPALVSPISLWELAMLVARGRIEVDREPMRWTRDLLASETVAVAELTPAAAVAAARLPDFHGDPADRFIYATAREMRVALVSKDAHMRAYARRRRDVQVIW
jgi:PIN domain nuclease of toxin-antitoxin system